MGGTFFVFGAALSAQIQQAEIGLCPHIACCGQFFKGFAGLGKAPRFIVGHALIEFGRCSGFGGIRCGSGCGGGRQGAKGEYGGQKSGTCRFHMVLRRETKGAF